MTPATFLAHATALAARHGPGPWPGGGHPLPDDPAPEHRPIMPATVLDGVRIHHFRLDLDPAGAATIADAVQAAVSEPALLDRLHAAAADVSALEVADPLITEIRARTLPADRLRDVARWLCEHGTRRNAVAVGVVLLGVAGDERDRELLLLLGALEDLCLYAAEALIGTQPDPERAVFALARRVEGWGRIHAVERLRATADPEITAWLLRGGFRNGVMDEYLAHLAATAGDLRGALAVHDVDEALLEGAGGILDALCTDRGPAADFSDYRDGPAVLDRYLDLVGQRPPDLRRIGVVQRIAAYLDRAPTHGTRDTCAALLALPTWRAAVTDALAGPDPDAFRSAVAPARRMGIAMEPLIRAQLERHPFDGYLWCVLLDDGAADAIDENIALAERLLARPAAGSPGLRLLPTDPAEHALDVVVGRLDRHPGRGWPLVAAGLRTSAVRPRTMAVRALRAWPRGSMPADAGAVVRRARAAEPDPRLREDLDGLLEAWAVPSDPPA